MTNFSDVIAELGYSKLAALIGKPAGTVSSWQTRNLLPPEHWSAVVREARSRGIAGITHQSLAEMAERRAAESKPPAPAAASEGATL